MKEGDIVLVSEKNISVAWAKAFLHIMQPGVQEISPLVVQVKLSVPGRIQEDVQIRQALDQTIQNLKYKFPKLQSVNTVSNTIFPMSLWNPDSQGNAQGLFRRFDRSWDRISKCPQNRRGSYFRRLTSFRGKDAQEPVNQLEHVCDTFKRGNHRRSALQATIFDPALDHTHTRMLGFPCLQQVTFAPTDNQNLIVSGNYATQYLFDRAYGNYLGLCRLGLFMAKQMGLAFVQMNCISTVAQRGNPSKTDLGDLGTSLERLLADRGGPE